MPSRYYTCPKCGKPIEANFAVNNPNECYHEGCENHPELNMEEIKVGAVWKNKFQGKTCTIVEVVENEITYRVEDPYYNKGIPEERILDQDSFRWLYELQTEHDRL